MSSILSIYNPGRISFGAGSLSEITGELLNTGRKRLYIISFPEIQPVIAPVLNKFHEMGLKFMMNQEILSEPTFDDCKKVLAKARKFSPDVVIGIGGGSVLDVTKIVAALVDKDLTPEEIVGNGVLSDRKTHLICIPTTSGTGSEMSPNGILLDESEQLKKGIISPHLVPDSVYIDPELTISVPPAVTAATGMDALTHCIEAVVNKYAHPVIDTYALKGIELIYRSIAIAVKDPADLDARTDLALGSMYGGMCLGPVNTTAVHALSYPLGSEFHIPHGLSNAILLPSVISYNLPVAADRYALVGEAMGIHAGSIEERAAATLIAIEELLEACGIPQKLSEIKIPKEAIEGMAHSALKIQRLLKNNPRDIQLEDAVAIYQSAY